MDTSNIKRIDFTTQFSTPNEFDHGCIEEKTEIPDLFVTPELTGSLWVKAKECEKLAEDRKGWLSRFCLEPGWDGITLNVWIYVNGDFDSDCHEAIFQPLREMIYRQSEYQTRKIKKMGWSDD